jgi:N-dimethylarginine dimethylaminohydrolase
MDTNQHDGRPRILMCPPAFFDIEYEINPWMDRLRSSDHERAIGQWTTLKNLLESLGATICCLDPVPGLPDLVFTANAALIFRNRAILSRFRHPQRQGEEKYFRNWFEQHGFELLELPRECFFEGAGDALFGGETLFAGYRIRSVVRGHQRIAELLDCRVLSLELVDPHFYHLDTCFCPLNERAAVFYPPAFDSYAREVLAATIEDLIPASDAEARRFACNAVVLGDTVITNEGCPALHRELRSRGFRTCDTPLGEFLKAGGSAKCLTLRLDGEDAAAWRFDRDATASFHAESRQPPSSVTPETIPTRIC